MNKIFSSFLLCLAAAALMPLEGRENSAGTYDFSDNAALKKNWHVRGKQFGIPLTRFYIGNSKGARDKKALVIEANSSTGVLITQIPPEIWQKYPVMRWRWRILRKVKFDKKELDDQAVVLYFGDGSALKQFMMAYSWENFTSVGHIAKLRYGMGTRTIRRMCLRNGQAESSKWYVEERNVVEDFKKAFGRAPRNICGLTIGANSQYSNSKTLVEIDYIEFCKPEKKDSPPVEKGRDTAERKKDK